MNQEHPVYLAICALCLTVPVVSGVQAQDVLSTSAVGTPATPAPVAQPVRGWQLMSDHERASYRAAMRSLETPEEREALRKAIHEAMKTRATEKGLALSEEPPARGDRGQGARHGRSPNERCPRVD